MRDHAACHVALRSAGVAVVPLALPLWLGWPCPAPPPQLLGVLRPIPFGVDAICDFLYIFFGAESKNSESVLSGFAPNTFLCG